MHACARPCNLGIITVPQRELCQLGPCQGRRPILCWSLTAIGAGFGLKALEHAVQNTTKLGHLNCDLQLLRFEYLATGGFLEPAMCASIEGISDRIWKGWQESDEAALKNSSQRYRDVLAQQQAGWALLDEAAIEGPSAGARRDPEFLKAAEDYRARYMALDAELQKLATAPSSGG